LSFRSELLLQFLDLLCLSVVAGPVVVGDLKRERMRTAGLPEPTYLSHLLFESGVGGLSLDEVQNDREHPGEDEG